MSRQEFTKKQMAQAMLDCKGICKLCDEKIIGKVEYHHDVEDWKCKRSNQKSNTQDNCIPVHPECHKFVSKKGMGEKAKWDRQDKKYGGAAGRVGVKAKPSRPKQTIKSGGFNYPPDYNPWRK